MCVCVSHSVMSDSLRSHDYSPPGSPSMEFSRQEYWSELSFPTSEDLPDPGIEPGSPALQADFLPSEPVGKPFMEAGKSKIKALADLVSDEGPPSG